jgi:hypothetical protein
MWAELIKQLGVHRMDLPCCQCLQRRDVERLKRDYYVTHILSLNLHNVRGGGKC